MKSKGAKKALLSWMAGVSLKAAIRSGWRASEFGIYQPERPENMPKKKKQG